MRKMYKLSLTLENLKKEIFTKQIYTRAAITATKSVFTY